MLPILLIVAAGGGLLYLATRGGATEGDKKISARDALNLLKSKSGEERRGIMGGINDGSLEDATSGAGDTIEGLNAPPLAGAASGASAGMAAFGPIGAVVGAVIGAFAQNIVRLIDGSDVGDIVDDEIKKALRGAGITASAENVSFARHMLVLKQYAGELSTYNAHLAIRDNPDMPEHSWGILFRRWMQDYLYGDIQRTVNRGNAIPGVPRMVVEQENLLGFIPVAGGAPHAYGPAFYEIAITPGAKKCHVVRGYQEDTAMYGRFNQAETVLRSASSQLDAYGQALNRQWSNPTPVARAA